jgi:hypothetical protein
MPYLHRWQTRLSAALLAVVVASLPRPVSADGTGDPAVQPPTIEQPRQFDLEVGDIVASEKARLDELFARHAAAPDAAAAREVKLEIRNLRRETEIRLFEARVRHLRRQGLEAEAVELEAVIAVLRDPDARLRELVRPVEPVEEGGAR